MDKVIGDKVGDGISFGITKAVDLLEAMIPRFIDIGTEIGIGIAKGVAKGLTKAAVDVGTSAALGGGDYRKNKVKAIYDENYRGMYYEPKMLDGMAALRQARGARKGMGLSPNVAPLNNAAQVRDFLNSSDVAMYLKKIAENTTEKDRGL